MVEAKIYVGLNDAFTREQRFDASRYVTTLRRVCKNYHVAFSFEVTGGGYFHEDGTYVDENNLVLTLIDVDPSTVREIAEDLRAFFVQESVMITWDRVEAEFITVRDDIDVHDTVNP